MLQFRQKKIIRYDPRASKEIGSFPMQVRDIFDGYFYQLSVEGFLSGSMAKKLKGSGGLFEVRVKHNGQWRAIYVYGVDNEIVVLSAFNKKTQKTEKKELKKAKSRLVQYIN